VLNDHKGYYLGGLQNLSFGSFIHNAEDRTEAFFKKHEKSIKDITGGAFKSAAACAGNDKCRATIKKYAEKYGLKAVEDGGEVAEDALQNLYGSSHSYLQNLSAESFIHNAEKYSEAFNKLPLNEKFGVAAEGALTPLVIAA